MSRDELEGLLRKYQGNISAVARAASRSRMQVHRWLAQYRIELSAFRPR